MTPEIRTIDDVLPLIAGLEGVVATRLGGYTVVDVHGMEPPCNPGAQDCQGLKFDAAGAIIARPCFRFETATDVFPATPVLVHSCRLDGEIRMMTRTGVTEIARAAQAVARPCLIAFCETMADQDRTPTFAFRAEDPAPLALLAIRDNITGADAGWREVDHIARRQGVARAVEGDPCAGMGG